MVQIINDEQLDFNSVLLRPKRSTVSSRKDADVQRAYKFKVKSGEICLTGTGIFNANMSTVGNFAIAKEMVIKNMFATLHKHYTVDELYDFFTKDMEHLAKEKVFVSIGLRSGDYEKLVELRNRLSDYSFSLSICIDVPNAYIPQVKELVIKCRNEFPDSIIMVGNVVTGDITEDLILSGANIVKVGIGPGSVCRTRKQAGVGRPQLSAILECADAAHQVGGMICGDGGITCPGDVCKAFAGGADFIMIGGYFAGTTEAEGEIITRCYKTNEYSITCDYDLLAESFISDVPDKPKFEYKQFKIFYGMSSKKAQDTFYGGMPSYRASEGIVVEVPYTGSISDVLDEILGGLRSMMTYIGATSLKHIPKCATFYKVRQQYNTIFKAD